MNRATLGSLGVLVFVLAALSFVVRAASRFVVGPRTATLVAGPIAVAATVLLAVVLGTWLLSVLGLTSIEEGDAGD